jgi:hypothetical protein
VCGIVWRSNRICARECSHRWNQNTAGLVLVRNLPHWLQHKFPDYSEAPDPALVFRPSTCAVIAYLFIGVEDRGQRNLAVLGHLAIDLLEIRLDPADA